MSPTLRSLASLFLLLATIMPNASAAPNPPDAAAEEALPFAALARIGPTKALFTRPVDAKNPSLVQIAFSPDGRFLAALGHRDNLLMLDVKTGMVSREIDTSTKSAEPARSFSFAPDGKMLALSNGGIVSAMEKGKEVARFELPAAGEYLALYSQDGKTFAVVAGHSIALHAAATGKELLRKPAGMYPIGAVAFSTDGKQIAVGGYIDPQKPPAKGASILRSRASAASAWRLPPR